MVPVCSFIPSALFTLNETVARITYSVLVETLNPAQSINKFTLNVRTNFWGFFWKGNPFIKE